MSIKRLDWNGRIGSQPFVDEHTQHNTLHSSVTSDETKGYGVLNSK